MIHDNLLLALDRYHIPRSWLNPSGNYLVVFEEWGGDRAQLSGSRNTEFDTQLAYNFGLGRDGLKKVRTQMFLRYADRYGRSDDHLFGITNLTRVKIMNAGLTITFF